MLNIWEDVTAQEEEESIRRAEALVEKEQALHNSVYRKDYYQVGNVFALFPMCIRRMALSLGRRLAARLGHKCRAIDNCLLIARSANMCIDDVFSYEAGRNFSHTHTSYIYII